MYLLILFTVSTVFLTYGGSYRLALAEDHDALAYALNTAAQQDGDKLVILPKIFREHYLAKDIATQKYFCAYHGDRLVAFKKMFILEHAELETVLREELSILGKKSVLQGFYDLEGDQYTPQDSEEFQTIQPGTYIYTGSDFTLKEYRRKGINQDLIKCAFKTLMKKVTLLQPVHIVLGLTESNAGKELFNSRIQALMRVLKSSSSINQACPVAIRRFSAFMPTFDPESVELKPRDSQHSVPGFGYIITAKGHHE